MLITSITEVIRCGVHTHALYFCPGANCRESFKEDRREGAIYGCSWFRSCEENHNCVYCGAHVPQPKKPEPRFRRQLRP